MKTTERPQALIEALQARGFSQSEIAKSTGIAQSKISRLLADPDMDMKAAPYFVLRAFAVKCGIQGLA